jgi:hypothetical protein
VSENSGRDGETALMRVGEDMEQGIDVLSVNFCLCVDSIFMCTQLHVPTGYSQVRTRTLRL